MNFATVLATWWEQNNSWPTFFDELNIERMWAQPLWVIGYSQQPLPAQQEGWSQHV
jgi:hypothetical protein